MQERPPLILFSGLAADASVFDPQKAEFPQLVVPKWITPQPRETLNSYCDRLADRLGSCDDSVIGGASFGGIIALHVAHRLKPRAVILLGSVRSPRELSRLIRIWRPIKSLLPLIPVRLFQACCVPMASKLVARHFPNLAWFARQFRDSDAAVFRWSLARILDWETPPVVSCPVFHIHGNRDRVLPVRYTNPDSVIIGGGHVITLSHPIEVNDFIETAMDRTMREVPSWLVVENRAKKSVARPSRKRATARIRYTDLDIETGADRSPI